jgi:hypothetical protein
MTMADRRQEIRQDKSSDEIPLRLQLFKFAPKLQKFLKSLEKQPYYQAKMESNNSYLLDTDLKVKDWKKVIQIHKQECNPRCPMKWDYSNHMQNAYREISIFNYQDNNGNYILRPIRKRNVK